MLEDVSAFINNITFNKPTAFKMNPTIAVFAKKPGQDSGTNHYLKCSADQAFRQLIEAVKAEKEADLFWRASDTDTFMPFEQFVEEAMMPPVGHSGPLYERHSVSYAYHSHASSTP